MAGSTYSTQPSSIGAAAALDQCEQARPESPAQRQRCSAPMREAASLAANKWAARRRRKPMRSTSSSVERPRTRDLSRRAGAGARERCRARGGASHCKRLSKFRPSMSRSVHHNILPRRDATPPRPPVQCYDAAARHFFRATPANRRRSANAAAPSLDLTLS